jgi:heat shock protein HslJ
MRRAVGFLIVAVLIGGCDKAPQPAAVDPSPVTVEFAGGGGGTIDIPGSWTHISYNPGLHVVLGVAASPRKALVELAHPPSNTGNQLSHLEAAELRPDDAFLEVWIGGGVPAFGRKAPALDTDVLESCFEETDGPLGQPLFRCVGDIEGDEYDIRYWSGPEASDYERQQLADAIESIRLPGSRSSEDVEAYEGPWRLVEGYGPKGVVRPIKGWDVSAHIEDRLMAGNSSCNNYYLEIKVEGSRLSFPGGGSIEEMGCGFPGDVQEEYIAALLSSDEIAREGDRLIITGSNSRLVFEAATPAPIDEMVGRDWRLVRFTHGHRTQAIAPAMLRFTRVEPNPKNAIEGKYAGTTGCGRFSGTYTVQGERVVFLSGSAAGGRCSDKALQEQHDAVSLGISDWITAEVDGNKLTVFADRSLERLIYRAR